MVVALIHEHLSRAEPFGVPDRKGVTYAVAAVGRVAPAGPSGDDPDGLG